MVILSTVTGIMSCYMHKLSFGCLYWKIIVEIKVANVLLYVLFEPFIVMNETKSCYVAIRESKFAHVPQYASIFSFCYCMECFMLVSMIL